MEKTPDIDCSCGHTDGKGRTHQPVLHRRLGSEGKAKRRSMSTFKLSVAMLTLLAVGAWPDAP